MPPALPMGLAFSVRQVLSEKRKGKVALTGNTPLDEALWELAEVLAEIARNGSAPEAGQKESSTINTKESATDEQSAA